MFDAIHQRIAEIKAIASQTAAESAPIIQARLTRDATTRRGNVPSFSPGGPDVPITATAEGDEIRIRAVDWVIGKAIDKGQPEQWLADVHATAERIGGGK
jgi:hypothetical protein